MWLLIMTVVWWTGTATGSKVDALWAFETEQQCTDAQEALSVSVHPQDDQYVQHKTLYACVEKTPAPAPCDKEPAVSPKAQT